MQVLQEEITPLSNIGSNLSFARTQRRNEQFFKEIKHSSLY